MVVVEVQLREDAEELIALVAAVDVGQIAFYVVEEFEEGLGCVESAVLEVLVWFNFYQFCNVRSFGFVLAAGVAKSVLAGYRDVAVLARECLSFYVCIAGFYFDCWGGIVDFFFFDSYMDAASRKKISAW